MVSQGGSHPTLPSHVVSMYAGFVTWCDMVWPWPALWPGWAAPTAWVTHTHHTAVWSMGVFVTVCLPMRSHAHAHTRTHTRTHPRARRVNTHMTTHTEIPKHAYMTSIQLPRTSHCAGRPLQAGVVTPYRARCIAMPTCTQPGHDTHTSLSTSVRGRKTRCAQVGTICVGVCTGKEVLGHMSGAGCAACA